MYDIKSIRGEVSNASNVNYIKSMDPMDKPKRSVIDDITSYLTPKLKMSQSAYQMFRLLHVSRHSSYFLFTLFCTLTVSESSKCKC